MQQIFNKFRCSSRHERRLSALHGNTCMLAAVLVCGLSACDQSTDKKKTTEYHWTKVTKLIGGTADQYFIVVDGSYMTDKTAYEDAIKTNCNAIVCMIGFFRSRNDVPGETYSADFYNHGGWQDRAEIAHYFGNSATGLHELTWDCNLFPQPVLNDCFGPAKPSAEAEALMNRRGELGGFRNVKFGMSQAQVLAALGKRNGLNILPPQGTEKRVTIRTNDTFAERTFASYYNVVNNHFSALLMQWKEILSADACKAEADKIANAVERQFGKNDDFSYFDSGHSHFRYLWRFTPGTRIAVSNINSKPDDCVLSVNFDAKGD